MKQLGAVAKIRSSSFMQLSVKHFMKFNASLAIIDEAKSDYCLLGTIL